MGTLSFTRFSDDPMPPKDRPEDKPPSFPIIRPHFADAGLGPGQDTGKDTKRPLIVFSGHTQEEGGLSPLLMDTLERGPRD